MSPLTRLTVEDEPGLRLDRWLAQHIESHTRSQIQQAIEAGHVLVGEAPQPARYKVALGDQIACELPDASTAKLQPESIALNVIFEDESMIVIDKPAGLVVHPAPGHQGGTVANALLAHCGPALTGVGGEGRWGIVHRLDQFTSGLMMAAKTQPAFEGLTAALAARRVSRRYVGIIPSLLREPSGTIDAPIGRRPSDRKRMGVIAEGRASQTDWTLLCQNQRMALLGLTLRTGRTHQIRVHLQSIGKPILGDKDYGWTRARAMQDLPQGLRVEMMKLWPKRQMLHAAALKLAHPLHEGLELDFRSNPPEDMRALLDLLWQEVWPGAMQAWLDAPQPEPEAEA